MTGKYRDVLDLVDKLTEQDGHPPTVAAIAAHYGIQRVRARRWVACLEQEGLVEVWVPRDRHAGYVRRVADGTA